jgi:hypothetical protein
MEDNVKKAIEEYQCSGCMTGSNTECFEPCSTGIGCGKHYAGTMIFPGIGKIFLGLPKGFNRLGEIKDMKPFIFEDLKNWGEYNKFNILSGNILTKMVTLLFVEFSQDLMHLSFTLFSRIV